MIISMNSIWEAVASNRASDHHPVLVEFRIPAE